MNATISSVTLPEVWRRKHLTPAEQKVIALVAAVIPSKGVAARLRKSTATVCNQLYEAMRKLGVPTRYELSFILRPVPAVRVSVSEPEVLDYAI